MIKMTGRTVLVAGETVLIVGAWSEVGAHSALPAEVPDTTAIRLNRDTPTLSGAKRGGHTLYGRRLVESTRPGPAPVEDREHFRPSPPACTKAPAPAPPRGHDHRVPSGGAATSTDLLAASSHPHQEVW